MPWKRNEYDYYKIAFEAFSGAKCLELLEQMNLLSGKVTSEWGCQQDWAGRDELPEDDHRVWYLFQSAQRAP